MQTRNDKSLPILMADIWDSLEYRDPKGVVVDSDNANFKDREIKKHIAKVLKVSLGQLALTPVITVLSRLPGLAGTYTSFYPVCPR